MAKLIHGIAYNSGGKYKTKDCGVRDPAYRAWFAILSRCYAESTQARQPTYIGCSIDSRWYDYQDFAEWFYNHKYSGMGYQLDKDLLIPDNKIYSPETCCFVPQELNKIIIGCGKSRGKYPQGVDYHKQAEKYRAQIRIEKRKVSLGLFDSTDEAHRSYISAKESYVKVSAIKWRDKISANVFQSLMNWRFAD